MKLTRIALVYYVFLLFFYNLFLMYVAVTHKFPNLGAVIINICLCVRLLASRHGNSCPERLPPALLL